MKFFSEIHSGDVNKHSGRGKNFIRFSPESRFTSPRNRYSLAPEYALGYSYELWTYALLQSHVRKHCAVAGHPSLLELSRSKLHLILTQGEVRPHKIRYYVERRDPEFERKMIEVLHVYKEVKS